MIKATEQRSTGNEQAKWLWNRVPFWWNGRFLLTIEESYEWKIVSAASKRHPNSFAWLMSLNGMDDVWTRSCWDLRNWHCSGEWTRQNGDSCAACAGDEWSLKWWLTKRLLRLRRPSELSMAVVAAEDDGESRSKTEARWTVDTGTCSGAEAIGP